MAQKIPKTSKQHFENTEWHIFMCHPGGVGNLGKVQASPHATSNDTDAKQMLNQQKKKYRKKVSSTC